MQEIVYLEPEKVRGSGLTADEVRNIGEETKKRIMSLVSARRGDGPVMCHSRRMPATHDFRCLLCNGFAKVDNVPTGPSGLEDPALSMGVLSRQQTSAYFVLSPRDGKLIPR